MCCNTYSKAKFKDIHKQNHRYQLEINALTLLYAVFMVYEKFLKVGTQQVFYS